MPLIHRVVLGLSDMLLSVVGGLQVCNFTNSFSDGRLLCYLIHHYHPSLLPLDLISNHTTLSEVSNQTHTHKYLLPVHAEVFFVVLQTTSGLLLAKYECDHWHILALSMKRKNSTLVIFVIVYIFFNDVF